MQWFSSLSCFIPAIFYGSSDTGYHICLFSGIIMEKHCTSLYIHVQLRGACALRAPAIQATYTKPTGCFAASLLPQSEPRILKITNCSALRAPAIQATYTKPAGCFAASLLPQPSPVFAFRAIALHAHTGAKSKVKNGASCIAWAPFRLLISGLVHARGGCCGSGRGGLFLCGYNRLSCEEGCCYAGCVLKS